VCRFVPCLRSGLTTPACEYQAQSPLLHVALEATLQVSWVTPGQVECICHRGAYTAPGRFRPGTLLARRRRRMRHPPSEVDGEEALKFPSNVDVLSPK
jgi:hypothetical protein